MAKVERHHPFQDLIIIFWNQNPPDPDGLFKFWGKLPDSRYYQYYEPSLEDYINTLLVSIDIPMAEEYIKTWMLFPKTNRKGTFQSEKIPLSIYLGFQGSWYTRSDFFDIIKWSDQLAETMNNAYTGSTFTVEWLPNDWFDHPGLLPDLTTGQDALDWLEEQNKNQKPETIDYDYKGAHYE